MGSQARVSEQAVAQIETIANELFGFQESRAWLKKPTPLLGWQTPKEALACPDGPRRVREALAAIRSGEPA